MLASRLGLRATDQAGFSLIEVLVAMMLGLIICAALFTILEVSLRQSTRIADRTNANQRGRYGMEDLLAELHSSCLATEYTPIEKGSTGNKLLLVSEPSEAPSPASVTLHEIVYEPTSGSLTDTYYESTSGSIAPNWTFYTTPKKKITLLTNVSEGTIEGTRVPIFRYYQYEGSNLATSPLATPLSTETANETAAVNVTMMVAPEDGNTKLNRPVTLSDTAVLRYAPSALSVSGSSVPCT